MLLPLNLNPLDTRRHRDGQRFAPKMTIASVDLLSTLFPNGFSTKKTWEQPSAEPAFAVLHRKQDRSALARKPYDQASRRTYRGDPSRAMAGHPALTNRMLPEPSHEGFIRPTNQRESEL
ncbi:MAG: hypothetical protein QM674_22470 [Burkholderiaceae bacterium]